MNIEHDNSHVNQTTLSGLLEDVLSDPDFGNGDQRVDWSAKLDEIERLAKAAT